MSDRGEVDVISSFNQSSVTNQSEVNGSTNCDQVTQSISAYPFFMTVYSLVFLVGSLLNGFVMKFYFCGAQRQASSSIMVYLKNLVAADFLVCLCLPIRIINYASDSVTIRLVYCNFGICTFLLNMYASIMFMGYIAGDRYLKIVHGTSGTHILQTVRAAHIISTVTWVLLLASMSGYIIMALHTLKPLTSVAVNCEVLYRQQHFTLSYKIMHTLSIVTFLFVLVSLVFFYYSTSRRVSLAQQRQPESSSSKKLAKTQRNMLVLVCVFCFCFVPYHLVRLTNTYLRRNCSWRKVSFNLMEVTISVSALNVCLDPLIYFIFSKALRTKLRQSMRPRNR
ncbi:putative G-protein coupled receptor 34 [Symphorus nematophorus]